MLQHPQTPEPLPYTDEGAGRPVLFLHGFMGSAADWAPLLTAWQPLGFTPRALCVDLPGHGAATALPPAAFSFDAVVVGLEAVLDAAGVVQADVVGYSMGGRLALYFALARPARCRRLVLESASPGLASPADRRARRAADEVLARRLEAEPFDAFVEDWYRRPLFASLHRQAGLAARLAAARAHNAPAGLARALRGLGTGCQPSLWERLPALQVSTVAVAGALDAKYVALAQQMAAAGRRLRAAVVPEAGHNVHAEQPAAFAALVHAFLTAP